LLSKNYLFEHNFERFFSWDVGLDEVIDLLAERVEIDIPQKVIGVWLMQYR